MTMTMMKVEMKLMERKVSMFDGLTRNSSFHSKEKPRSPKSLMERETRMVVWTSQMVTRTWEYSPTNEDQPQLKSPANLNKSAEQSREEEKNSPSLTNTVAI